MSASSPPTRVLVATRPYPCLDSFARVIGLGWSRGADEDLGLAVGGLSRRKLLELLVALSSGVDEVLVECEALAYQPLAEAVLAYRWLLGEGYRVTVFGACCGSRLVEELGLECRNSPCD